MDIFKRRNFQIKFNYTKIWSFQNYFWCFKTKTCFVYIINNANLGAQTANPFLYNTFSVSTNPRTLSNCHLVVGNGDEYPEIHYTPSTDKTRVYRDVLKYVHKNNEYDEGTLLNINNFSTIFLFIF